MNDSNQIETMPIPADELRLSVLPDYQIEFDPEPYIVLCMGFGLDKSAPLAIRSNKVLARQYVVHEFKHYRDNGSKFWTAKGGCDLYLALLKSSIRVVKYHGGSWPKVEIGGEVLTLNVSGGGGGIWTDWIRRQASTCVDLPVKTLKAVIAQALTIEQARDLGVTIELKEPSDNHRRMLENALARKCAPELQPGMRLQLAPGYRTNWNETLLTIQYRNAQHFICAGDSGRNTKVTFPKVDWAATAQANGIDALQMDAFNFVAS